MKLAGVMKSQHCSNGSMKMSRTALSLPTGYLGALSGSGGFFLDLLHGDFEGSPASGR